MIKRYFCVTSSVDDRGNVKQAITDVIAAETKPESSMTRFSKKDIYNDWFSSREEAEQFMENNSQ